MKDDFLDEAVISVAGGHGGDGSVHFRREKFVPLGGPDGGDGGRGGDVVLRADTAVNTLLQFRYQRRFQAQPGAAGSRSRRHGRAGTSIEITVPVGTNIYDAESDEQLADLARAGQSFTAARGGQGGLGNSHFATSTRQAPNFAEKGQPAEERTLRLELKLVADVGLVGLPNAGKSTLLATISAARPKIADYPFTTLAPNLGVVGLDDYSFVVADIPGLIEGAHSGKGLGDRFLRHIQRTRTLLRVVDASSPTPHEDLETVTQELRQYDPELLERPQIVALTKIDLPDARARASKLKIDLGRLGLPVYAVSAVTHEGLDQLLTAMRTTLEQTPKAPEPESEPEEYVYTERESPQSMTVTRKRGTFVVQGEELERVVSMTDLSSAEAVDHLQRRLKRLGLMQALARAGVRPGNTVRIGEYDLVWEGELEPELATPSERTDSESRRRSGTGTRAYRGRRSD